MAKIIHIPMYMSYVQLEQAYKRSGIGPGTLAFDLHEHFMMVTVSYTKPTTMRALGQFMQKAGLLYTGRVWFEKDNMYIEFNEDSWDADHHSDMSAEELRGLGEYED